MFLQISKLFCFFCLIFIGFGTISAQDGEKNDPTKKLDLPETMRETFAKRRIREEEEQYQELIKKSEEAVKLSEELSKSFEENKQLSAPDTKKLEQLEKLIKKIRKELGAEDEEKDKTEDKPSSIVNALTIVKEKSANLLAELKKTSRHSLSVIAVESSNIIWNLVRFLRLSKN
jgi:type I site-specific restriction endonuclease